MTAEAFFDMLNSFIRGALVGSVIAIAVELKLAKKEIDLLKRQMDELRKESIE